MRQVFDDDKEYDILKAIQNLMPKFSKGQKKIALYILENYDSAAFYTASKLGMMAGVSESTVVRFATLLGFAGYPQFQEALSFFVKKRLDSIEKIEIADSEMEQSKVLTNIMLADAEKIKLSLQNMDADTFESAVDMINNANHIYIVGIRSCAPLAEYLSFYLRLINNNVHMVTTNSSSEMFEQMLNIKEQDVVIGISFPRYSLRTLKCMEYANNKSARVIALTDSKNSPMCLYSSCNLIARSDMASIVESLVAPMSVINALVVALCLRNKEHVSDRLEELSRVWDDYQVYENDEINQLDEDLLSSLKEYEE